MDFNLDFIANLFCYAFIGFFLILCFIACFCSFLKVEKEEEDEAFDTPEITELSFSSLDMRISAIRNSFNNLEGVVDDRVTVGDGKVVFEKASEKCGNKLEEPKNFEDVWKGDSEFTAVLVENQ
jgi:hypothetical protein